MKPARLALWELYCAYGQCRPKCFSFLPSKAPTAPGFIHFSELTTTSVNVSWGEPKQANGIIEGYRLVYEPCTPVDGETLYTELLRDVLTSPQLTRD